MKIPPIFFSRSLEDQKSQNLWKKFGRLHSVEKLHTVTHPFFSVVTFSPFIRSAHESAQGRRLEQRHDFCGTSPNIRIPKKTSPDWAHSFQRSSTWMTLREKSDHVNCSTGRDATLIAGLRRTGGERGVEVECLTVQNIWQAIELVLWRHFDFFDREDR